MTARPDLAALRVAAEAATPEREADPGQQWKFGDEFLPFHRAASHIEPDYRDGWNDCYGMAARRMVALLSELEALRADPPHLYRELCPDDTQPDSRDPDCPACQLRPIDGEALRAREAQPDVIEAARKGLEALEELTARGQKVKGMLAVGVPDGDPVHPASAALTWPLSTALLAIAALRAALKEQTNG